MNPLEKLKRAFVTGTLIERCIKKLDIIIGIVSKKICYSHGKIQKNKIFIMTYDNKYSCNPRYINEEIVRRDLPYDVVWAVTGNPAAHKGEFPPNVRLVQRSSYEMLQEMASAKIWIDNALNCVWDDMPKKKEQIYINTWHGSMGIKRLHGNEKWMEKASRCDRVTNYCVANSTFEENVYRSTFWPNVEILRFGHARNDILFNKEEREKIRKRVYQYFDVEPSSKLFLYAPTFRDDGTTPFSSIDFCALKKALETRFQCDVCILVRLHFKNSKSTIFSSETAEWMRNATFYPDMQELLVAADMGLTDYSSWAYDFVLTKRPLFLYAPDIADYDQDRGFYYPLESTPFPLAHNNQELTDCILQFNAETYSKDVERFLQERGCYEEGQASKRIVDKLEEIMK